MEKISAKFKIVTPLFLGGAEPEQKAELRPSSIKGALRFWYRAIDPEYKEWEEKIFGSTKQGQGVFNIRVFNAPPCDGGSDVVWHNLNTAYLGYGPILKKKTTRAWFTNANDKTFEVILNFKKQTPPVMKTKVERALWALAVFGGLGARSRRGFGSLAVERIEGMNSSLPSLKFNNPEDVKNAIEKFLGSIGLTDRLPNYTAWSKKSRCLVTNGVKPPDRVFNWLGNFFHDCRSYHSKSSHKLSCVDNDHNIMCNYIKNGTINGLPKRTAFGLPHNYFFTECVNKKGAEINLMDGNQKGRRASPVFMHVQGLSGGNACCVVSFFPAPLILGKQVRISKGENGFKDRNYTDDISAITEYLDNLALCSYEVAI